MMNPEGTVSEDVGQSELAELLTPPSQGSESSTPPTQVAPLQENMGIPTEDPYTAHQRPRDEQGRFTSPEQPVSEAPTPEQTSEETFTTVDPNTLAPELQQVYRSMQSDYTKKTQALAEQRRQYDFLEEADPDVVREAIELHSTLQDPASWQALHAELTAGLRALGLSPQEAAAEATRQITEETAPQAAQMANLGDLDPDLAPFKTMLDSQRRELDALKGYIAQQQRQEAEYRHQQALIGEWTRQMNVIRQAHPDWTDDDIGELEELSSFYDGDLLKASNRYVEMRNRWADSYVSQKESVPSGGAPLPGAGTQSIEIPDIKTLDDSKRLALEFAAALDAAE